MGCMSALRMLTFRPDKETLTVCKRKIKKKKQFIYSVYFPRDILKLIQFLVHGSVGVKSGRVERCVSAGSPSQAVMSTTSRSPYLLKTRRD